VDPGREGSCERHRGWSMGSAENRPRWPRFSRRVPHRTRSLLPRMPLLLHHNRESSHEENDTVRERSETLI